VLEIARWQCRLGHSCTILTGDRNGPRLGPYDGFHEAGGAIVEFDTRGPQNIRYMPELRSYLKRRGREFDLYVIHGSYEFPAYAVGQFCRRAEIPYIFMPHGSLDPAVRIKHRLRNRLIDTFYHDRHIRSASSWHFTSEQERADCERPIWRSSFVEPLGIDLERIPRRKQTGTFRRLFDIPDNAILLLFLSRITRKKGIDILLQAFRRLAPVRKVFLALCGPVDEDMRVLVEAAMSDDDLKGRLVVPGLLLGDKKDAAFFDSDYFVLPTYSENFGIAAFEALAYGLPLITTTGMNLHADLLQSGRAQIVEPNADALYSGLLDAVDQTWRPSATPEQACAWLEGNFSWRIRAERLSQHYLQVLKDARQAQTGQGVSLSPSMVQPIESQDTK
jgi:glycosyltransferase involved in cell wall biosynthesis